MVNIINEDHDFLNQTTPQVQYYKIQGTIKKFMADRPMFYSACPDCKKKVIPADSGNGWHCEKCQKAYPEPNWTYNFSMRIGDFTDDVYIQVLGEAVGD